MTRACAACLTPSTRIYCSDDCKRADEAFMRARVAMELEKQGKKEAS